MRAYITELILTDEMKLYIIKIASGQSTTFESFVFIDSQAETLFARAHSMRVKQACFWILLGGIILRVFTFIVSTNYGADSIVRTFITKQWVAYPFFVWHPNDVTSVWLPLQFYIDGLAMTLWRNELLVTRFTSLLLSLGSIAFMFLIVKRLLGETKACISTVCFALYALQIKHGNIAGSESLFIFTILAVILAYHHYLDNDKWYNLLFLSGTILFASMVRFETWLLPSFLSMAILLRGWKYKSAERMRFLTHVMILMTVSSLFILIWMYGSYRYFGDPLHSMHVATTEHTLLTRENISHLGRWKTILYNSAFWPGTLFISLSPLVAMAGLWGMVRNLRTRIGIEWVAFAGVQAAFCLYHSIIIGDLAPLSRYTILGGTVICLFVGDGALDLTTRLRRWIRWVFKPQIILSTAFASLLFLSGPYYDSANPVLKKLSSISPVTHYPSSIEDMITWLRKNLQPHQRIMFNSNEYDATNAMVIHSGIAPEQCVSINQNDIPQVTMKLAIAKPNFVAIHKTGPLQRFYNRSRLPDSIFLGDIPLKLSVVVGDFGIYLPTYR